jgi:amidophosphoribosyltransferase
MATTPVNQLLYDGLMVLQHRGQDAAGIATAEGNTFHLHKGPGLVRDVFRTRNMRALPGNVGIGHVRYPTAGSAYNFAEAQPFYVNSPFGIVLGHNGNLTNAEQLKDEMFRLDRRHINTNSDSEVLLNVLAHELQSAAHGYELDVDSIFQAVAGVHRRCRGAYAVVVLIAGYGLLAFRDPHGIRPLVYGQNATPQGMEYLVSSESVALDTLGFQMVRDIEPGEAIFVDLNHQLHARQCAQQAMYAPCIFEYVYLARPDTVIDGVSVYEARLAMGELLAEKVKRIIPVDEIDVVIPIPIPAGHRPCSWRRRWASLPRGFRQESLCRTDLHHARPGHAQEVGAPEAEYRRPGVQGQARAAGRRLHRAWHDQPRNCRNGACRRRDQGLFRFRCATGAFSERLRHRHADPCRADRHRSQR